MKIVAFLQNQWFHDPDRIKKLYEMLPEKREDLNRMYLFMGCVTGRRLRQAFGWRLCDQVIVWEEVTTQLGSKASDVFPPDFDHMRRVIHKHQPTIILAFGKVAANACMKMLSELAFVPDISPLKIQFITEPHPASRHATVAQELRDMANQLK